MLLYFSTGLQQYKETLDSINIRCIHTCLLGPALSFLTYTTSPHLFLSQWLCAVGITAHTTACGLARLEKRSEAHAARE